MIKHPDDFGKYILIDDIEKNTIEIVMFIWKEIRQFLIHVEYFNQKLSNQLNECEENLKVLLANPSDHEKIEAMKLKWNKLINELELFDSKMQMKEKKNY